MTMPRPSFFINADQPGSDIVGEAAAALAATSIAVRNLGDSAYANAALQHARELFNFADQHRGIYSDYVPGSFYT